MKHMTYPDIWYIMKAPEYVHMSKWIFKPHKSCE